MSVSCASRRSKTRRNELENCLYNVAERNTRLRYSIQKMRNIYISNIHSGNAVKIFKNILRKMNRGTI